jgi:hypothetical protein
MVNALHSHSHRRAEFDTIAWGFLGSEFAKHNYADWPIGRRVDAYLRHHDLTEVADDGSVCDALVQHIMANIGHARRSGVLPPSGPRTHR